MLSDWIVELSHWQWVLLGTLHVIFIPLTLGLALLLAALETAAAFTGKPFYQAEIDFWKRLFALNLVLMLSTRLPWLLQFGFYDSYFSHYAGDVFALPLALESVTSLVTIATLFGPYWFGWGRLGKYQHLGITWLIAIAVHVSVFWSTLSNAWLENPVGAEFDASAYRLEMVDFGAVLQNPILPGKFLHLCANSHAAAAGAILAIAIYRLAQNPTNSIAKTGFNIGAVWGLAALLTSLCAALITNETPSVNTPIQAAKWATLNGNFSPSLQHDLDQHIRSGLEAYRALQILRDDNQDPQVISTFQSHRANLGYAWLLKPVHKTIVDASDKQIQLAGQSALPRHPKTLYWLYKIVMVLSIVSLIGFAWATWQSLHLKQLSNLARAILLSVGSLPWIGGALDLWLSLEAQHPWIIAGQLPTAMGLSTLTTNSLIINLIAYIVVYALLLWAASLLLKQWLVRDDSTESGVDA